MAEINRIAKDADERQAVVVYTYPWSRYLGPGIGLAGILFVSGIAAIFVDSWGAAVTLAFLMIIALVINIPRIVAELKAPRILEIKDGELTAKWLGRSRKARIAALKVKPATRIEQMIIPPSVRMQAESWQFRVFKDLCDFEDLLSLLGRNGATVEP